MLSKARAFVYTAKNLSRGAKFSTTGGDPGAFELLRETKGVDKALPQFVVGTKNGFLPRQDPLEHLPSKFSKLETLLNEMTINKADGSQGYLARGEFGDKLKEVPQYDVSDINDTHTLTALFRDYAFATSAYMLEPCHLNFQKTGEYGLGRSTIPKNIAVPFWKVAEKLHARPFMEYAMSYILSNWKMKDPNKGIVFDNLNTIRKCEGSPSEEGFGLVHVTMDAFTGELVSLTENILSDVARKDVDSFNKHLQGLLDCMQKINDEFETMWNRSKPSDYINFRTFIMGIKNQPMFPKGVIYEGVTNEPQLYRGETGANDSIVPTVDNLLEVTSLMPDNPLTQVLRDFRTYRPRTHNHWVNWVEQKAKFVEVRKFALANAKSSLIYLGVLDQLRDFRFRHWNLTKAYIIAFTTHPVATGGSPIVTWLPNQLRAVLDIMEDTNKHVEKFKGKLSSEDEKVRAGLQKKIDAQRRHLEREVADLKKKYPDQDKTQVYN